MMCCCGGRPDIERIKSENKLGEWNLYAALYNTPDNVEVMWPMVQQALESIKGSRIYLQEERQGDPIWQQREGMMRGIPAKGLNELEKWQRDYRATLGFACPLDGEDITSLNKTTEEIIGKYGFDELTECVLGWRSLIKRVYLLFDDSATTKANDCINELIASAEEQGFGLTHSSTTSPDINIQHNTAEGMDILQTRLKTALDADAVFV